jgi:broad specificity phosphatase PhoE
MGDLEGKTREQIKSRANIEPIALFVGRGLDWWDFELMPLLSIRQAGEEPLHILAVSHGAFIAQFVNSGLIQTRGYSGSDITSGHRVNNTSISVIEVQEDGTGFIPMYADIKHILRQPGAGNNADLEESSKAGGASS